MTQQVRIQQQRPNGRATGPIMGEEPSTQHDPLIPLPTDEINSLGIPRLFGMLVQRNKAHDL